MKTRLTDTLRVRASIAALTLAAALLAVPAPIRADDLYVVNDGNSTILRFAPDGTSSVFASTYLSNPIDLVLGSQGTLYVANYTAAGYISRFTRDGMGSVFATTTFPATLALDSAANLYVSDYVDHTITKFTPGGVGSVFASTGSSYPGDMAFDTAGNLYVAGTFDNTIFKFTPGGVRSVFATTGLNYPEGLAFDTAGNLYVSNSGGNSITKFTPSGTSSLFASVGLDQPRGLAFDSAGNLYAANQGNNTIQRFTPDGVGSVFASGLNNPLYIAIQIPEPSAWILLTLGIPALLAFRGSKLQGRQPPKDLTPNNPPQFPL